MKTDVRAYSHLLTNELAVEAGNRGLSWADVYVLICSQLKAKSDNPNSGRQDFVELIDPIYIQTWVKNNVQYSNVVTQSVNKLPTYTRLVFHGKPTTARELAELTGLRQNTIYIYWVKCGKDPTAFDIKIDRRLNKIRSGGDVLQDEGWEIE